MTVSTRTPTQTYRRQQRILSASVDDETVMMSVARGQYYNLNAVGGHIWRLLETPRSLDQIVTSLAEVYDAPEEKIAPRRTPFSPD
ncbi:PqqD family peptide modification chaperone [Tistrella bauzanensis]